MTNIVIGVDGSEHAYKTLGWAIELAKDLPEPVLHLVHAWSTPLPISEFMSAEYDKWRDDVEAQGRDLLDQMAGTVSEFPVETYLREELPAQAILGVAEEVHAALVAVGSHGLSRPARLFLGGVSTEVLHRSPVPVLVVRNTPMRPIRQVLVGVDESEHSARALGWAHHWLGKAKLTAMHVLHVPAEARVAFTSLDVPIDAVANRVCDDVVQRTCETAGIHPDRVEACTAVGNAADELVYAYRSGAYDLAVVGSRGLGPIGELFLGSVSERLARLATGPVVVVK